MRRGSLSGVWQHWKGGYYQVLFTALDSTNSIEPRWVVVYVGLTLKAGPRVFVREIDEFLGQVEDAGQTMQRFRYLGDEMPK